MNERTFTWQDQIAFADFSGDHNPWHIDPVAARRFIFGAPVVHGIHSLLWALDMWLRRHLSPVCLRSIKVSFLKPVMLNEPVQYVLVSDRDRHAEMTVRAGGSVSTRIDVEWTAADHPRSTGFTAQFPVRHSPCVLSEREIETGSGKLDLFFHTDTATRLFPYLTRYLPPSQVAVILNTSRLVGVECPGLHSIYSELALSADDSNDCDGMRYEVTKFDTRFALVVMKVTAPGLNGSIKAFVRPAPQRQAAYHSLKGLVPSDEFAGQRALIVGGSRGLGEVTAKLLCAGGAQVKITYFQGKEDAQRIVDEIASAGGRADCFHLDVLGLDRDPPDLSIGGWSPTHLYYFATPFIFLGTKGKFSTELFNKFCGYYVTGLMRTIDRFAGGGSLNIFFPSSTAVDEVPLDMGEYVAGKMAGEMLCEFLQKTLPKATIISPRIPRVATDQTVSFMPIKNLDPVPVIIQELRFFHNRSVLAQQSWTRNDEPATR
ncbi:MAG: SDR family NAD(P)-dependent oxidoreductase [Nitrospirae bacterium]|nr:SDR family NAD(P)-dependent oxidoreductase [Nitrospirota bacterium]